MSETIRKLQKANKIVPKSFDENEYDKKVSQSIAKIHYGKVLDKKFINWCNDHKDDLDAMYILSGLHNIDNNTFCNFVYNNSKTD